MSLIIPKGRRRQIRDAVLARLTAKGNVLDRYVKTWQLYQGRKGELQAWSTGMLPAIRVGWLAGPMTWSAEAQHSGRLNLAIKIGVAGSDEGDLMDFWEALEGVLFPPNDRTFLATLEPFGVNFLTIVQPAISHTGTVDDPAMEADGIISIKHNINT